ncbi:MAG: hypothetical protein JSV56_05080 [Methanomassiliicoccales archaeon]|nr:MAG: hypothetical protein JSV56_05080 [Methanomassiliicoccales archaeon]
MDIKGHKLIIILVTLALLLNIHFIPIPTEANPLTEVIVDLNDEPVEVDVSPDSSGVVTINGIVTCKKWGPDQVKVYLNATSTVGGASVIPPSIFFGGGGGSEETHTISAATRVPEGTSSSEVVTVTVSGYYEQGGMQYDIEQPDSVLIIVKQYYLIKIYNVDEDKGLNLKGKSGKNMDFSLDIRNAGNGNDIFMIDFMDRDVLESDGFRLPQPKEIVMIENANESVDLRIGIPDDKSGLYHMALTISSEGSQETDSPEKVIVPIKLDIEEQSVGEKIGAIVLSPLFIIVIAVIIVIVVVLVRKRSK